MTSLCLSELTLNCVCNCSNGFDISVPSNCICNWSCIALVVQPAHTVLCYPIIWEFCVSSSKLHAMHSELVYSEHCVHCGDSVEMSVSHL